ncbi:hypothetical protein BMS3Abin01_00094 [bacterium BMS3Abin01]|nr:hypothetical protein BMS3Abin01_00094 [bacterium BMS3Abin01]
MLNMKLTTMSGLLMAAGLAVGMVYRPLLVPWLLASCLFAVNFALSLVFFKAMSRLSTSAAAGVAVISFLLRLGLMGLGLVAIAVALPEYFLFTAVCFLAVYTLFFGLEIALGIKGRGMVRPPAAGGEA